jgi:CYTH domain-containing protein
MFDPKTLSDFEFERRFFCNDFPEKFRIGIDSMLHIQSYYLASDGYNIRVRATTQQFQSEMTSDLDVSELMETNSQNFDKAFITVKAPSLGGSRYEAEREIEPSVAIELILRGGTRIVKNRYTVWIKSDGWVVDVFGGSNFGLILAECERDTPVTDLEIPSFCLTEVTDDFRFTNDNLSVKPFPTFQVDYLEELKSQGQFFSDQFGQNRYLTDL